MPFCKECGNELGANDRFCKQCGTAQQAGIPPVPAAAAATGAAASKAPLYTLIGVLSVLVVAGLAVGLVFLVKGCSESKAEEEADKYVDETLGYIDEVDAMEDDLIEETRDLDFSVGTEQFQVQVESIQKQLKDATVQLESAAASLEKIDRPSLPDWWDDYISMLDKAYKEKAQAYGEWDEFISRMAELDEFNQAYQNMVNAYTAALNTLIQAIGEHDAEQYAAASGNSAAAQAQLAEARAQLDRLTQLEQSVDLSQVSGVIAQVESFIPEFQRACDLGNAGYIDEHNALVDQLRPAFQSLPGGISFDIAAWIASIRDQYIASIEDHLEKEAEYRRRAQDIWDQNNR